MRKAILLFLALGVACRERTVGAAADSSGLATVFDSSRVDTVIARVAGEVPADRVRSLTEEMRIQPSAEDTSLFGEVFTFVVGRDGRMFVPDEASHRIFIFGADGALLRVFGRAGAGPGEFNQFNGLTVLRDGRLAVLDVGNGRVQFFSADGELETSWRVSVNLFAQEQLRTDSSGALRMMVSLSPSTATSVIGRMGLVRIGPDGTVSDSLLPPDLGTSEISFVAEERGVGRSQTYATYSPRAFWAWHPDGYFVSANGGRAVIEVSRPGRALRIERDGPTVQIPADETAWDRERILVSMRRNDPSWSWRGDLPMTKPPLTSLRVTRDGRIWASVATPSVEIPVAERDPQRENWPPPRRYRSPQVYEVFDASGRFAGRVTLPPRTSLINADGDLVWTLERDPDGLAGVVRRRVTPGWGR